MSTTNDIGDSTAITATKKRCAYPVELSKALNQPWYMSSAMWKTLTYTSYLPNPLLLVPDLLIMTGFWLFWLSNSCRPLLYKPRNSVKNPKSLGLASCPGGLRQNCMFSCSNPKCVYLPRRRKVRAFRNACATCRTPWNRILQILHICQKCMESGFLESPVRSKLRVQELHICPLIA